MKLAFMVIYMDNFKAMQCVISASDLNTARDIARDSGIKLIVSVQYLNAYMLN